MHRVLMIRLGDSFVPATDHLAREYSARQEAGALPDLRVAFVDAPPEGVGNLSQPIASLREKLEASLKDALTELLRATATGSGEIVLDVFLLANLGEPLVVNATEVVVEMLREIVDADFRAIFPAHRRGTARRFRVVPLFVLPAGADGARSREDAVTDLGRYHEGVATARTTEEREHPVDRIFLVDALTTRGITPLDDLLHQVLNFLRAVLFSGLRRLPTMVDVFEAECSDLFASFGAVACEVDFIAVRDTLTARMTSSAAAALASTGSCTLPTVDELLPASALQDVQTLERVVEELGELPIRTLGIEGSAAIAPLVELYEELNERLTVWSREADDPPAPADVAEPTASGSNAGLWSFLGAVVFGAAVFALAHFGLLLAALTSAVTGGAFAALVFFVLMVLLRAKTPEAAASDRQQQDPAEDVQIALERLAHAIERERTRLGGMQTRLDAVATSFSLDAGPPTAPVVADSPFRRPLVSEALLQLMFDKRSSTADARALADRWLQSLGTWEELLSGAVDCDPVGLEEYCGDHFRELGGQPLFADARCRECVSETVAGFFDTWAQGVPIALEGETRKQFDPDGFRYAFTSSVVAPAELATEVERRAAGGTLELHRSPSMLDDIFVLSIVLDIHHEAVAALADQRQ